MQARNNDLRCAILKRLWPHPEDIIQKVDLNRFSVKLGLYNGGLRRVIVHDRLADTSAKRLGKFVGYIAKAEVVDVLGCVGAIEFKFIGSGIVFGP